MGWGWIDGWMDGRTDGWMDARMDGTNGRTDGRTDGWTDGWTDTGDMRMGMWGDGGKPGIHLIREMGRCGRVVWGGVEGL